MSPDPRTNPYWLTVRSICDAATPGPWQYNEEAPKPNVRQGEWNDIHWFSDWTNNRIAQVDRIEDQQFIAIARVALPLALNLIEELAARLEELERK